MGTINDGYMMLLDEFMFNGKVLGLVSGDGLDWGGDKPNYNKLMSAQKRNGPVKKVMTEAGTNVISFKMIQMIAENCVTIAGGTANGEVWNAPETVKIQEGKASIKTGTGQTITIPRMSISGVTRGKLGGSDSLYLECEAEILAPLAGGSPFSIGPTTPSVDVSEASLDFPKAGSTEVVRISASGAVTLSAAPAGFTLAQDGNYLVITAANNTGTARTGTLTITLVADPSKTATIALNQLG